MRENWSPPAVHLNVISGRGGLGDSLARIPALNYLHETHKHVSATVYVQDGWLDLIRFLLPETSRRAYKALSEAHYYIGKPRIEFDMERLSTLHLHLTEHAYLILMDQLPPTREDTFYPRAEPVYMVSTLPKDMIVFTTDFTARAREWPAVYINSLAVKVREAGLTPVLIGRSEPIPTGVNGDPVESNSQALDQSLFIDLRNKTTLTEALGIMQRSRAVIGVDNGLLHLAHYTDVPVVYGFTSLEPAHRLPRRPKGETIALESLIPCKGCQSRGFAVNTDWRECLFGDYICQLTLTSDRFYKALQELKVI